jgi:NADH-quinone oxidoreductase subunit M
MTNTLEGGYQTEKLTLWENWFSSRRNNLGTRYRRGYSFWFYHLGWVYATVVGVAVAGVWWIPTGVVYLPVGVVLLYVVLFAPGLLGGWGHSQVGYRSHPGVVALWLTLLVTLLVGTAGVTQIVWATSVVGPGWILDEVSTPFVLLTVGLAPVVVLASLDGIRGNQYWYYGLLLLLLGLLVPVFCVTHFLVFYVLFEVLGFPMFLLVGMYGPRAQRVDAAYKFFIYTFVGSAAVLPVLVYLYTRVGTTEVGYLLRYQFTDLEQTLFFGLAALPFAVKIPVMPVHLWLPEAHVEAPTPVSMVLAALLLKTGGYAFVRFLVPVWPWGAHVWGPTATTVGVLSVLWGSVYALVQVDTKRMIAYASVAHMSLVFVGLLSGPTATAGGVYLMLAHGWISAGLFAGIGVLYDRYHTRTIRYLGGLASVMPVFSILFFVCTLGNFSFPFTAGFTGEFLLLLGIAQHNLAVALAGGSTVLLSLAYSVWLYNRVFYGTMNPTIEKHQDLTPLELGVMGWCTAGVILLGWTGGYWGVYANYDEVVYTLVVG